MKEDVSVPSLWFYQSGRLWAGPPQRENVLQPRGQTECVRACVGGPVGVCVCVWKATIATSEAP